MRKILSLMLATLMLFGALSVTAFAETTDAVATETTSAPADTADDSSAVTESMQIFEKTYTLHMDQYRGEILSDTLAAAFWEYPVFAGGQRYTVDGLLVIRNDSHMVADVKLDHVSLPYGDEQKMKYLNHLMITVTELTEEGQTVAQTTVTADDGTQVTAAPQTAMTETVVFDGPYSRINDTEGGLKLVYENMQPGEEHTYRINMHCLYTYDGDPNTDTSWLKWNFSAHSRTTIVYEEEQGLPEWAKLTLLIFAATIALLIVIMIITAVVGFVKNAKERKAAKLEARDLKAEKKAKKQAKKEEKRAQKEAAKQLKAAGMYQPSPDDEEAEKQLAEETAEITAQTEDPVAETEEPVGETAQETDGEPQETPDDGADEQETEENPAE